MIGVTEPRRVAAISMAKRVGYELNLKEKYILIFFKYLHVYLQIKLRNI